MATPAEADTDSASVQVAATFQAFLMTFKTAFERVHRNHLLSHRDKKEETLRFLPESLLDEPRPFLGCVICLLVLSCL